MNNCMVGPGLWIISVRLTPFSASMLLLISHWSDWIWITNKNGMCCWQLLSLMKNNLHICSFISLDIKTGFQSQFPLNIYIHVCKCMSSYLKVFVNKIWSNIKSLVIFTLWLEKAVKFNLPKNCKITKRMLNIVERMFWGNLYRRAKVSQSGPLA